MPSHAARRGRVTRRVEAGSRGASTPGHAARGSAGGWPVLGLEGQAAAGGNGALGTGSGSAPTSGPSAPEASSSYHP
jgi:hypothetical protein